MHLRGPSALLASLMGVYLPVGKFCKTIRTMLMGLEKTGDLTALGASARVSAAGVAGVASAAASAGGTALGTCLMRVDLSVGKFGLLDALVRSSVLLEAVVL